MHVCGCACRGRNVESPGEDPLVCGMYGSAYAEGLQRGSDPDVYQAIVTLKHWIAYSVENYDGVTRHTYDANVTAFDLADAFFPAFKRTVQEGGAMGIMCSYNELNGKPTCGNPALTATLREDWGFQGYITSDSDSIADIWKSHHYEADAPHAVRDGLEAGCDIDSGNTYRDNLATAVNTSLVDIKYARESLMRTYKMRFLLGLFDPNVTNPYRDITTDVVGSADHQATSLLAARKSMVLLQNHDNLLPLKRGLNIALIGTDADSGEDLLGNYNGPICSDGKYDCVSTIKDQLTALNTAGSVTTLTDISDPPTVTAAAKAGDVVVFVASNAKDGGGEGHDRYNISLAADQMAAAEAALAAGKPLVLVLINGGIIAIDDLKNKAPAILEAFMPGVHGAQAIAESIFGDNNPGGKMPVTMYESTYVDQVDFLNMSMQAGPGRSYRYYSGTPLFTFGFGLSYTNFTLQWSPAPPAAVHTSKDESTTYTVKVTNTGKVAGDEVVMAFFKPKASSFGALRDVAPVPIKQLFGFQRVALAPGQDETLTFVLNSTDLSLVDHNGNRAIHNGEFDIVFTRGHGMELQTVMRLSVPRDESVPADAIVSEASRTDTFRKWW